LAEQFIIYNFFFFKDCALVIGVEIQEEAVNMAKLNATENGITNAIFFAGKAEEAMNRREFQNPENANDVVAIVDPPRAGLRKQATDFILSCINNKKINNSFNLMLYR